MKGWMPAAGVLLVVAGAALWLFARDGGSSAKNATALQPVPLPPPAPAPAPALPQPAVRVPAPVQSSSQLATSASAPNWKQRLRAAADYHDFVESIFPAARDGHASAQFYLSEALQYCDDGYRLYFDRRFAAGRRTLDEALDRIRNRDRLESDRARLIHARCRRLMERPNRTQFGAAPRWLMIASDAGDPMALARRARLLSREVFVRPEGVPPDAAKVAEVRTLGRRALQSRDPDVVMELSVVAHLVRDDPDGLGLNEWSWTLLACLRGSDCSADVPWVQDSCAYDLNCQTGETGVQFMQRALANEYPEIERRAAEIGANLDAGNWEALGFGE